MLTKETLDRIGENEETGGAHPGPSRLTVCGRMEDRAFACVPSDGWLIAALVSEWVGQEPRACRELRTTDTQFFLPQVRILVPQPHMPPKRRLVPAFPGYLFVLPSAPDLWHGLKRTPGIAGVLHQVGAPGSPYIVPAEVMGRMLARASKLGVFEDISVPPQQAKLPPLPQGVRIKVTGGYLTGETGEVAHCKPAEVRIRLDSLGIVAIVPRSQVEALAA